MNTRGRPGTLAPTYHDEQVERSDTWLTSLTCSTHLSSSSTLHVEGAGADVAHVRHHVDHPVDVLFDRSIMLASTDGLPGPVTMNRLGKPADATPR